MNQRDDLMKTVQELDELFDQYHPLFCKRYPPSHETSPPTDEPKELFEMVKRAQALLIALGPVAVRRFEYLGFSYFFGFDNASDRSAWYRAVNRARVDMGDFHDIYMRVSAEADRLLLCLTGRGGMAAYEALELAFLKPPSAAIRAALAPRE